MLPLLRDQILGPPVGQEGPVPLPTSQRHSCPWLWSLWGFSPRDLGVTCGWRLQLALLLLAASPSLSAPLGSSPIFPSGQLPQGQTRENKQKPKFLGSCGWRGLSVLPAGTGRSVRSHAPASCPPSWACPWPRGSAHSSPAAGTKSQAVSPLNEEAVAPVLCSLGQWGGWVHALPRLKFGICTILPCIFLSILLSVHRSICQPSHPSIHPSISHPSIYPFIHFPIRHCYKVLWIPYTKRYKKVRSCEVYIGELVNNIHKIGV